jgi:hypothetical protein
MLPVLKSARRPLVGEWQRTGLDAEGWTHLGRLADDVVRHPYFEHLKLKAIRESLADEVRRYRALEPSERPQARDFAGATIDALASQPMLRTLYLGVENLDLPHNTVVAGVRFVEVSNDPRLAEAFSIFEDAAPRLVCEVEVTAGTLDLLRQRARDRANAALGLIRQQNLFGFNSKIYLEQVLYSLDGKWTLSEDGKIARSGWWREKVQPIPMDLAHPNGAEWRKQLAALSDLYSAIGPKLRTRVDTCIEWLDVAALSKRWRIIVPAVFSGMESLLVPENVGLKAGLVTVRSVAVHVALDHTFFDPGDIVTAYGLRSDLVHGTPRPDVLDEDGTNFAEMRRRWAFEVLRDYLTLVANTELDDIRAVVAYLDTGKCNDVCDWLDQFGAKDIVREYRTAIPRVQSANYPNRPG